MVSSQRVLRMGCDTAPNEDFSDISTMQLNQHINLASAGTSQFDCLQQCSHAPTRSTTRDRGRSCRDKEITASAGNPGQLHDH